MGRAGIHQRQDQCRNHGRRGTICKDSLFEVLDLPSLVEGSQLPDGRAQVSLQGRSSRRGSPEGGQIGRGLEDSGAISGKFGQAGGAGHGHH